MYSTCIYCNSALGRNEVAEAFPVGRRVAFDAEKGRLWVVCRRCERWNLAPLEERWEVVETYERLFRETRRRVSTENIGLARLPDGLELVRIGRPQRPEFAAWRYGDQFGRWRRRSYLLGGAGVAAATGLLVGLPMLGLAGGGWLIWEGVMWATIIRSRERLAARLPVGESGSVQVRWKHSQETVLAETAEGWRLKVPHDGGKLVLEGEEAIRAAALILPALNHGGGSRREVSSAVAQVEEAGSAERLFARVAREKKTRTSFGVLQLALHEGPPEVRLALEMAANEETERAALEGELAFLERAWREAEEIAAIADRLAMPDSVEGDLERLRERAD